MIEICNHIQWCYFYVRETATLLSKISIFAVKNRMDKFAFVDIDYLYSGVCFNHWSNTMAIKITIISLYSCYSEQMEKVSQIEGRRLWKSPRAFQLTTFPSRVVGHNLQFKTTQIKQKVTSLHIHTAFPFYRHFLSLSLVISLIYQL